MEGLLIRNHWVLCWALLIVLASCSQGNGPEGDDSSGGRRNGAWFYPGTVVLLGSDDTLAGTWETPLTTAVLSDSVFLASEEVSRAEWMDLMKWLPTDLPEGRSEDNQGQLPVSRVTLYDAMRFCNRLSQRDGMDTVYRYLAFHQNADSSVDALEGLKECLDCNGWRLPSEAEWMAAGRGGDSRTYPWGNNSESASTYAWFANNADGRVRSVAAGTPIRVADVEFHGLTGNVMEWTQDWLGRLPGDTVIGYGGVDPSLAENGMVVKGGAFSTAASSLRSYVRTDVYQVLPYARLDRLGIRLARGARSRQQVTKPSGTISEALSGHVAATRSEIAAFFGTTDVKLVAVDIPSERMFLVDWSRTTPLLSPLPAHAPVRHPALSPDGLAVLWGSVREGVDQAGTIHGLRINAKDSAEMFPAFAGSIPRWHVEAGDTTIVYATSARANTDSAAWLEEQTLRRTWKGAALGNPSAAVLHGAFHDGSSADGRWFATAYTRFLVRDNSNGQVRQDFLSPANGKDSLGSTQVCNLSVAPAGAAQALFLDFGYPRKGTLMDKPYTSHAVLFRSSLESGAVLATYPAPSPYLTWDGSEWSTHPGFAVATLAGAGGTPEAVYALRFNDGAMLRLVSGANVETPHLHVGSALTSVETDSLFAYEQPSWAYGGAFSQAMRNFLLRLDSVDAVALGSSRLDVALNPAQSRAGYHIFNLATPAQTLGVNLALLEDYVVPRVPGLKVVVLNIDIDRLTLPEDIFPATQFFGSLGWVYDRSHSYWSTGFSSAQSGYLSTRYIADTLPEDSSNGFRDLALSSAGGWDVLEQEDYGEWSSYPEEWQKELRQLDSALARLDGSGIRMLGVTLPQSPGYATVSKWGRYGPPTMTIANAILDSLKALESRHPDFRFADLHRNGQHSYLSSEAYNSDHLNAAGAVRFTAEVDSLLREWP